MRFFLIFCFLTLQGVCMGQFNTVKCLTPIFEAEIEAEEAYSTAMTEVASTPLLIHEDEPQSPSSADSLIQDCLQRYESVALPLSKLRISSRFGSRKDPFTHKPAVHHGLDLSIPSNTEVYSMFHGKVLRVSYNERSGNFITVQHGDYTISFCHLSRTLVKAGDIVKAGDVIALSGNSGRSTGPHLHITVRRKGDFINPTILLNYIIDIRTRALQELSRALG